MGDFAAIVPGLGMPRMAPSQWPPGGLSAYDMTYAGWGDWGASSGVTQGSGGYYYQLLDSGDILIVYGPRGSGTVVKRGSSSYNAIRRDVASVSGGFNPSYKNDVPPTGTTSSGGVKSGSSGSTGSTVMSLLSAFGQGTGTGEGQALSNIITAFQSEGKQAGYTEAARAAGQYGPGMVAAASEVVKSKGQSLTALQRKYSKAKAKCDYYNKLGKRSKASNWCSKRDMYAKLIQHYQAQAAPIEVAGEPPGGGMPTWLPLALVGGGGLLMVALLAGGKGGSR